MKYTIKLCKTDTECLRQTVTEAFNAGRDSADAVNRGDEKSQLHTSQYYGRLLQQIEVHAGRIAEQAFEAGRKSPPLG